MRYLLVLLSILVTGLAFSVPKAFGFIETSVLTGYRSFSTLADHGDMFVPQVGARLTFLEEIVSPEISYDWTRAQFSSIKIQEHGAHLGVRLTPDIKGNWFASALFGFSYFYSQYSGGPIVESKYSTTAIYAGAAITRKLGIVMIRLDISDRINTDFQDSSIAANIALGVSL